MTQFLINVWILLLCVSCTATHPGVSDANFGEDGPSFDGPSPKSTLLNINDFGDNPGDLGMWIYLPQQLIANPPLVVLLHGCTQDATDSLAAGWRELADHNGFVILLPEQNESNQSLKCFNWYSSVDNSRGQGESQSIIEMMEFVYNEHSTDRSKTFVAGFSAGAAFATALLANYPESFSAGAIQSGVPFGCAKSPAHALSCQQLHLNPLLNKTPNQWGDEIRQNNPSFTGRYPRLSIWHGTLDLTVNIMNARALTEQWTNIHGAIPSSRQIRDTETGQIEELIENEETIVEYHRFDSMGHALSIDSSAQPLTCNSTDTTYFYNSGVCASHDIVRFFKLDAY